jgi:hypothetical protein
MIAGVIGAMAMVLGLAPGAGAQTRAEESRAEAVLERAQEIVATPTAEAKAANADDPAEGRRLSYLLGRLSLLEPSLDGAQARAARALLARPDDGVDDRYGDGYTVGEPPESPACTTNFCVHWVASTTDQLEDDTDDNGITDGDGVPDFIEAVQDSAEESFAIENGVLGWDLPLSDGMRGGGGPGLTDVYMIETGGRYFGYASPDEGQGQATSKWAYLVLDNGYSEFADPPDFTELEAMQATMAHEYNHVLQFTLDSRQDLWMFEATATWVEDRVYPAIDDYLNYVPDFASSTTVPLDSNGFTSLRIYGAAMWNHFLDGTEGPEVIREAWEDSDAVSPAHQSIPAYDSGLGGTGFPFTELSDAFSQFTASTPEWRTESSTYADAAELPNVRRSGKLRANGRALRGGLDHLSYALLRIRPAAAAEDLKLRVRGREGVRMSIALTGRSGPADTGSVTMSGPVVQSDGRATTTLAGGSYDRVTAVVANADARLSPTGRYRGDNSRFAAKLDPAG